MPAPSSKPRVRKRERPAPRGTEGQKLTEEQQEFAVCQLATFRGPGVVAAELKAEFGVDIARQSIEGYDPTKRAGRALSERWKKLFFTARETFLKDTAAIGSSHKTVRVRRLDELAEAAIAEGEIALAAKLFEQIAKEMGESYTNKQKLEHTGKDGAPLFEPTDEDRAKALAAFMAKTKTKT